MKTIRVTGRGQIKVHPDLTRITIELEGTYREYQETLKMSAWETEELKDMFLPFGFERTDLKTLSFNVDTEYERYTENGEYKSRFAGYKYRHQMKLEFDSDNTKLGKVLFALANSHLHPHFRISYTVKDPESVKNELLGRAVQDAIAKAEVLSGAAGQTLGDIQDINYSWGRIEFEFTPMREALCECDNSLSSDSDSYDLNIEPDDIEAGDTVTIVWELL